jgi:hypothetical protein
MVAAVLSIEVQAFMESTLGEHAGLLVEMTLLAVMIAVGISFVFLLAYVEVELGGLRAAWRRLRSPTFEPLRGHRRRSVAVRRIS